MLQVQQLPQDPLQPEFLQLLEHVLDIFVTSSPAYHGAKALVGMPEQLLSLDLVPMLLGRLMRLDPQSQRSQEAASCAQGAAEASAAFRSGPSSGGVSSACATDLHRTSGAVTAIMVTLSMLLKWLPVGRKTAAGDGDLALVTIEQLLSSPAALKVAVHRGLCTEVQEAARMGCEPAWCCMEAVSLCFRRAAAVLCMHKAVTDAAGNRRGNELCKELAGFLQAEENLPFLEPLCLPPADFSTPPSVPQRVHLLC
jgi:hypothetical protein